MRVYSSYQICSKAWLTFWCSNPLVLSTTSSSCEQKHMIICQRSAHKLHMVVCRCQALHPPLSLSPCVAPPLPRPSRGQWRHVALSERGTPSPRPGASSLPPEQTLYAPCAPSSERGGKVEGERRGGMEEGEKSEGEVRRRRRTCREWEAVRIWNVRESE